MVSSRLALGRSCRLILLFGALLALLSPAAFGHPGFGRISGIVVDQDGVPLQGVTVSTPGTRRAVTDDGGVYSMAGVLRSGRTVVTFAKEGYATTQGVANFQRGYRNVRCWLHQHYGRYAADRGCNDVPGTVTLSKTLLKAGARQSLDSSIGGSLVEGGFKVTFPANALTASGTIDVSITPIDVSTAQLAGAPGDFAARDVEGNRVQLESFSMADFVLTRNGRPVNLRRGATADIELLLPVTTRLRTGDSTPMWYFDTTSGLWIEEGSGLVGPSTVEADRLAIFASVRHFTYWNSDMAIDSTCTSGFVVDTAGNPLGGVSVEGFGVDYAGHSYTVPTDANGHYCIQVKTSGTTKLVASTMLGGITLLSQNSTTVTTGSSQATCAAGGCLVAPDIVLSMNTACVAGQVLDASGNPLADTIVQTSQGAATTTDASGNFQLPAVEYQVVRVYVPGYPYTDVTTGSAADACIHVTMKPAATGTVACLTGRYLVCGAGEIPAAGETVGAYTTPSGTIPVAETVTDSTGTYCLDSLPLNSQFYIKGYYMQSAPTATGSSSGTCASKASCQAGPDLTGPC